MNEIWCCKRQLAAIGILGYYFPKYASCYQCEEEWETCLNRVKRRDLMSTDSGEDEEKKSGCGLDIGW